MANTPAARRWPAQPSPLDMGLYAGIDEETADEGAANDEGDATEEAKRLACSADRST